MCVPSPSSPNYNSLKKSKKKKDPFLPPISRIKYPDTRGAAMRNRKRARRRRRVQRRKREDGGNLMLVVPTRAATPSWNGYGARPTQSVGHGPWSMKHAGMPRYALKCKLVSHRVGVDGTSGPSLLLSCIDATSPCSREHLSEVCTLSSPSLLLLLTSSPFLVAWSVPYTPRFFSAPRHRNRISVTRRPWVVGMPLCPKVPFSPSLSSFHRAFLLVSNPHGEDPSDSRLESLDS